MSRLYRSCMFVQRAALDLFADWRVEGRENVPPVGPLLVVANHQSNFDPSLLSVSVPRRLKFMAKDTLFRRPVARWFLTTYGAFPLHRESPDPRAFRWALNQLARGGTLVVFPEGTRSRGQMKKANPGLARLVLRSQAPLLPVGITGTDGLGSIFRVFMPAATIRVSIGTVFSVPPVEGRVTKEMMESITDMVMTKVAALLPESHRGYYGVRDDTAPPASEAAASASQSPASRVP